jgi:hypothetical protein
MEYPLASTPYRYVVSGRSHLSTVVVEAAAAAAAENNRERLSLE